MIISPAVNHNYLCRPINRENHDNNAALIKNLAGVINTPEKPPVACQFSGRQAAQLNNRRPSGAIPEKKEYQGVDKVNQVLRHIASLVHNKAKQSEVKMVEVQCAVYNDKLHISSNCYSDSICFFLKNGLNDPREKNWRKDIVSKTKKTANGRHHPYRVGKGFKSTKNQNLHFQETRLRPVRHKGRLLNFTQANRHKLNQTIGRAYVDINQGKGVIEKGLLTPDQMKNQVKSMLETIHLALKKAKEGDFSLIEIHHGPSQDFQHHSSGVMHAEQKILLHLKSVTNLLQQKEQMTIVPLAGRYIPCAPCYEVEKNATQQGELTKEKGILLHRATKRVGEVFPGARQLLASPVLSEGKADKLVNDFNNKPSRLLSQKSDVVLGYPFDTQSVLSEESQQYLSSQSSILDEQMAGNDLGETVAMSPEIRQKFMSQEDFLKQFTRDS